jgi:hypothetical protein
MTSAGDGSGNQAAAEAKIKAVALPALHDALSAFQVGDKKYNAVINAIRAIAPIFGTKGEEMNPAAMQQMIAQAAKPKGPLAAMGAPPPGMAPLALGGGGAGPASMAMGGPVPQMMGG